MIVGVRRVLAWTITLPLTAAGVLCAHALAYAALGEPLGSTHAYLEHAPQLLAVLVSVALAALVFETRGATRPAWPFAAFALTVFAAQEHAERLVHSGDLPWLATRPAFLLGLALQVPFALAAWLTARSLLRVRATARPRPPALPALAFSVPSLEPLPVAGPVRVRPAVRGPPPSS
jgi:hypothetical protein